MMLRRPWPPLYTAAYPPECFYPPPPAVKPPPREYYLLAPYYRDVLPPPRCPCSCFRRHRSLDTVASEEDAQHYHRPRRSMEDLLVVDRNKPGRKMRVCTVHTSLCLCTFLQ
ncbi:unnamed protein product [Nezara viridula]|uniref:Uncharacterized protein n=1 Tax=Nezara viridula TaxID=85310 RepID=A0A9P0GZF3_NEZVI|nr:unnamed protein product [Nezara viridula]